MANGAVGEFKSRPLTAAECLHLARITQEIDITYINTLKLAAQWLEEARRKVTENKDDTADILSISKALMGVYLQGGCQCAEEVARLNATIGALAPDEHLARRSSLCDYFTNFECRTVHKPVVKSQRIARFHALCRGETIEITKDMEPFRTPVHQLKCRYVSNGDPTLLLQPVKLEELNKVPPYVAILHNIIEEGEMAFIKSVSHSRLSRGTIKKMEGQKVSSSKISQTTILPMQFMDNQLRNFRGRLSALNKLNILGFEPIQVANYGTGGYYNFHVDLVDKKVVKNFTLATDNRLVTMVTYITDVEAGGATSFPDIGIAAFPKKGNALLFRNLYKNGAGNIKSSHTSCPVMVGEKWIANQWVTRYHQEFHYPCSTNPFE